jgi:hypothetical protein
MSGGTGSFGGRSNSMVVAALPSAKENTVTDCVPSGDIPDTAVPPAPTGALAVGVYSRDALLSVRVDIKRARQLPEQSNGRPA